MTNLLNLNEDQRLAVNHQQGPLLIIAGAGTGKTTVITSRIKYLILEKKIEPSRILALTFTEKAALEMERKIDVDLPYGYTSLWISTFHSFCDRILRDEAINIGINPAYKLSTEAETLLFLRKHLFKLKLEYFRPFGNPYKFLQGLIQHFNRLKDDDISPEEYIKFAESMNKHINNTTNPKHISEQIEVKKILELSHAFKTYEDLKIKEGIMDFADLNSYILKLFRTRPNILKIYQKKFDYVLVDEYQDTNYAQNTLAMMLAGDKKNINVVGDDDQSIYRWRGAAIANILYFRKTYPKTKIITLTKNYRSAKEILDSAYSLIQFNNPDRLEVKEKINKKLDAMAGLSNSVKRVHFIHSKRVENEADEVKNVIKKLIKENNFQYKDFAILVRANDHSQPFVRSLERSRIPYQFLGPGHLFHQEEIKDLISYLKVLSDLEDSASFYRVLTNSIFNIDARDLSLILNFAKKQNISLFEACEKAESIFIKTPTLDTINKLIEMINKHLKRIPRDTAGQILYYFLDDSGLLRQYLDSQLPHEEKKAQNIAKLFEKLKEFEASHNDSSVFAVIEWIELAMQLGESPKASDSDWTDNNAVSILTVHSSKGLEFPVVFMVNLVTQRFPSRSRKEQIPVPPGLIKEELPSGDYNLQEERRLFYVGMTRAKEYLYLCASKNYNEGKSIRKLSPFVYEALGEDFINNAINKENSLTAIEQLSLLDLANEQIQTNNSKSSSEPENFDSNTAKLTINYISYSQIQSFNICPLHYKLKNILKIPTVPSAAQSFGITIHSVLREFYTARMRGEDIRDISLDKILENNWINIGYDSKDHLNQAYIRAKEILYNFIKTNDRPDSLPLALETPFNFYLNNVKIGGRIDRVDALAGNNIEIIDYKTGSQVPDEKKLNEDLQLSIYALAASEIHDNIFNKKPEDVTLTLWYVEQNSKVSTHRNIKQLSIIKQQILDKVDEISKSNFRCRGGLICKNCEYKILCQSYS